MKKETQYKIENAFWFAGLIMVLVTMILAFRYIEFDEDLVWGIRALFAVILLWCLGVVIAMAVSKLKSIKKNKQNKTK